MNFSSTEYKPDAMGEIHVGGDTTTITFRRRIDHPVERVWSFLTEPQHLITWWGDAVVDLTQHVFVMRWLNVDDNGETAVMHAVITELDPPHLLQTDGDLHGRLRWQLQADGEQTLLTFSSTLGLPDEYQSMVMAGWHLHLDALAQALDGKTNDLVNLMPKWIPIHGRYMLKAAGR